MHEANIMAYMDIYYLMSITREATICGTLINKSNFFISYFTFLSLLVKVMIKAIKKNNFCPLGVI